MKYFLKRAGERVMGVTFAHLTELQVAMRCDFCRRDLPKGARVVGKVVEVRRGPLVGARFSPTCLMCADLN
jgi:hypothetical protein